jgi:acyl-CoA synthetase (AMP-forming)/AMP-acid ligase II
MIAALSADKSANRGFPRLVCILSGGAPITDATIASCRRAFGDILHQVYGLTEAVPMTVMTPQEWFANIEGSKPLRSAGRILPFALLEIRNAEGKKLPIGEEGEIWCRCEAQMQGYWGDEELSKNRISDGWIRSGDIGRLDVNGYLYLLDRADDMIVSGGLNIFPAELETVIADHPKVIEVAVFGIPHDKWGETPMAVCRVATLGEITPEEIANLVTSRMCSYMKPTRVEFTTELLPKTVVGKLSRRTLRDPHWQGRDRRVGGA